MFGESKLFSCILDNEKPAAQRFPRTQHNAHFLSYRRATETQSSVVSSTDSVQPVRCDTMSLSLNVFDCVIQKETTGTCRVGAICVICRIFLSIFATLLCDLSVKIKLPRVPLCWWDGFYPEPLSCRCWCGVVFFKCLKGSPRPEMSFSISYTLNASLRAHVNNHSI